MAAVSGSFFIEKTQKLSEKVLIYGAPYDIIYL